VSLIHSCAQTIANPSYAALPSNDLSSNMKAIVDGHQLISEGQLMAADDLHLMT